MIIYPKMNILVCKVSYSNILKQARLFQSLEVLEKSVGQYQEEAKAAACE
jgi:hypothetical protein